MSESVLNGKLIRTFRYRLRPTQRQARVLDSWLAATRELYNAGLQERRGAWRCGVSVTSFGQQRQLPEIRRGREDMMAVPTAVLRGTLRRLDKSFQAFFRRVKSGDKPGYPRFRGAARWRTLDIDDLDQRNPLVASQKRLKVPFVGKVKVSIHRPMRGKPKAMRLTCDDQGRWWVTLQCVDVPKHALPETGREVGIDLGIKYFAATSDGELVENSRPLATASVALKRAQRRVSRRKRGSNRRRKAVRVLARAHERVANVRREHAIRTARALVRDNDRIVVEKLNIKGLSRSRLAGSVHDTGWSIFLHWLRTKAESAGREVVEVDPRYTSQTCPACGKVESKPLSQRVHACGCGCVLDRDVAAAQVILGRGARLRGGAPEVRDPVDPRSSSRGNTAFRAAGACPVGVL